MTKIFKTSFLGTTKKLPTQRTVKKLPRRVPQGCLFTFYYRSKTATDSNPFIIMISPKWTAKKGGTYFTGVNLNDFPVDMKSAIIKEFGKRPVGSVTYQELKSFSEDDPSCCVRTYSTSKVRALHKVEV